MRGLMARKWRKSEKIFELSPLSCDEQYPDDDNTTGHQSVDPCTCVLHLHLISLLFANKGVTAEVNLSANDSLVIMYCCTFGCELGEELPSDNQIHRNKYVTTIFKKVLRLIRLCVRLW